MYLTQNPTKCVAVYSKFERIMLLTHHIAISRRSNRQHSHRLTLWTDGHPLPTLCCKRACLLTPVCTKYLVQHY